AKVACTAARRHRSRRVRLTCRVTFASAGAHEARLVLRRGRHTVASARTVRSARVRLRATRALYHGRRYRLIVAVVANGQATTIRGRSPAGITALVGNTSIGSSIGLPAVTGRTEPGVNGCHGCSICPATVREREASVARKLAASQPFVSSVAAPFGETSTSR